MDKSHTIVLLMAAGFSRRFKVDAETHKLLYPFDNERTLLEVTFQLFATVWHQDAIMIVTNKDEPDVVQRSHTLTDQTLSIEGDSLGSSIASALEKLQQVDVFSSATKGILVALADMPFITTATLKKLQKAIEHSPDKIIRPKFKDHPGHPVYFPLDLIKDLQKLHEQDGAKAIIQNNVHRLIDIEVEDSGINKDIDRLSDLPTMR